MQRRLLLSLFGLLLLGCVSLVGCSFGTSDGAAVNGPAVVPANQAPTARVSFNVQLSDDASGHYTPQISLRHGSKTGSARVRFRLTGLSVSGDGSGAALASPTVTEQTVQVENGRANVNMAVPPGPAVAQVQVLDGANIEGSRDFSGAQDLTAGQNNVTVNPQGSRLTAERTADTVARVRFMLTGITVPNQGADLCTQARTEVRAVPPAGAASDDKPAQRMVRRFAQATPNIDPMTFAEIKFSARQDATVSVPNASLVVGNFAGVPNTTFWGTTDLSESTVQHMAFKEILRQGSNGFGLIACEHRYFPDCFAVSRVYWNAQGQVQRYFLRNRGYCYANFVMPDNSIIVGGNNRAMLKPFIARWTGTSNAHTKDAIRIQDATDSGPSEGLSWIRYFDEEATPDDPNAGVTAIRYDGETNGKHVLLVSVKDAAHNNVKVYRINAANGLDPAIDTVTTPAQIVRRGTITGSVRTVPAAGAAVNSDSAISDVTVNLYQTDGTTLVGTRTTDSEGNYTFNVPVATGYVLKFAKTGYTDTQKSGVSVAQDQTTRLEVVRLVSSAQTGTGGISGTIRSSANGQGLSGLTVKLFSGIDNTSGTAANQTTTGTGGTYSFTGVTAGAYTLQITGTGYSPATLNVVVVAGSTLTDQNTAVSAQGGASELRFVLTWKNIPDSARPRTTTGAQRPLDLDAHLEGPMDPSLQGVNVSAVPFFHMYYQYANFSEGVDRTADAQTACQQDYGIGLTTLQAYVKQDTDARNGFGPESIILKYLLGGTTTTTTPSYSFYVHDYFRSDSYDPYVNDTDGIRTNNPDTILGQSEAKVVVYMGDRVLANFSVPSGQQGFLWHVCDVTKSATGGDPVISPANDMITFAQARGQSASFRAALRASQQGGRSGIGLFGKLPQKPD